MVFIRDDCGRGLRRVNKRTDTQVQASVTNPNATIPPAATLPALDAVVSSLPGVCNSYVPQNSTMARFLYVVQLLASQNLYVVLSNNLNTDPAVKNPAK